MTAFCLAAFLISQHAAQIDGKLIHSVTKKPVPRASVQIYDPDGNRTIADTMSNAEGAFHFADLPAGRVKLTARHPRFAAPAFNGVFDLKPETKIEGLTLKLAPSSAINGRIVDIDGDPLQNVDVSLYRAAHYFTQEYWLPTYGARTDDRGVFRISGLPPGEFLVACQKQESTHRLTYYPNVGSAADAKPVRVRLGEDINDLIIAMPLEAKGVIRGNFSTQQRAWVMAEVPVSERRVPYQRDYSFPINQQTGAFEIRGLQPGEYRFLVVSSVPGQQAKILATANLAYTGQDVENLAFEPATHTSLSGKVIYEGASRPSARLVFTYPDFGRNSFLPSVTPSATDGTFTMPNIIPDRYRLVVDLGKSKAFVKSIRQGDREMLGQNFDITASAQDPITVVISSKVATLSGKVDRTDLSAPPGVIVLEALDRKPEMGIVFGGRTPLPQVNQDGAFEIPNLAAGKYRVYAFESIDNNHAYNSALLKSLSPFATEISLAEGEARELNLKQITAAQVEELIKIQ
jgi:hypothetical protein